MKTFRFSLWVILLSLAASASAATLVERSAAGWRWRPGTNEASTPVSAWRGAGFNDAQFTTAPAPFWYDATGDSSTLVGGTQIAGMQNVYTSLFLRVSFVVANTNEIAGLKLGALVDDGFVAWINGTEVLRVGVPGVSGDPVSITTLANNAAEPVPFIIYALTNPVPASYLVTGTNVLAVQVFQSTSAASSDLDFDASLESIVTETNPPTVLSVSPTPGTVNNLTQITVTFSEPVSGVVAPHLLIAGIGAVAVTAVNSATYTFNFAQPPYGAVPITWVPAQTIVDQALPPNRFDGNGPGATWSYSLVDNTPPTVTSLSPGAGATVRTLSSITVLFSEPVSGVGAGDLLINGSPATGITPNSASQYVFTFSSPPTGTVQVAWAPGHGIIDQAGNPFAGGSWTYAFNPNAVAGLPYISEFMASNTRTNAQNPLSYDWIEIYNPSPLVVNLDGWYLTDSQSDLKKWRFPATNLAGGGFLVVFASGNDQRIPGMPLHTSFQLNSSGEYLALVNPDGMVVSDFPAPFALQVPDVSYGFVQTPVGDTLEAGTNRVYFTTPSFGAPNLAGAAVPGPIVDSVKHTPNVPLDNQDLVVTARVQPSFQAVSTVTLRYRIMYSNELSTPMLDDGAHGDGAAGDGIYGATIPASLSTNGQMIRYFVVATDASAHASRWPIFNVPTNTAEYLGTIVNPTNVTSLLPIFHLFASNGVVQPPRVTPPTAQTGADSENGGRVSLFYDGEFYDNIYMELRGNTSAGQNKKSHRLEFNREHPFRHLPGFPRVRKTSLMAEFLDPAYIRQHLSFWLLEQMGMKTPYFYPVRAQLNSQFYGLVFHNDVIGQEQVERMGYDPKGALYKAAGNVLISRSSTGVFQKLEPDGPPDYTDYNQLCNGIVETATAANRRIAAYDMLDIPEVINYMAGARWNAENDDVWANMSLYRDTFGDQLWRIIPFDMNASWGQRYGGITPLDAIADTCKSHPLYGGSTIIACDGSTYNRMYDLIIALPELRQMLLRRQRTVLDRFVMEPGVPTESRLLETHIRYMTNLIWTEAFLDRASWGYSTWVASNKPLTNAVTELFNEFINLRRTHWSATHNVTNVAKPIGITPTSNAGIPVSQPSQPSLAIAAIEYSPASGNQLQEYLSVTNPNPIAVDISGWKLGNGVNFTFHPGTVVPSNSVVYVSPSIPAFRARTTGPRGGQGLFVVGPYKGQLSARGEALTLQDDRGRLVYSNSYPGSPSLAQQYLRVTEIMYNPAPLSGNTNDPQLFEYLELKNISPSVTLDLNGVRFTNALTFGFTGSAVTNLAPGQRVLVVRNINAFTLRYGAGLPVAGQYVGALDSNGERIQLIDAFGEEILDFAFNNAWYTITDGLGFSLAVVGENADPDAWNSKTNWAPNGTLYGTPGQGNTQLPSFAPILITEVLSHTDPPLRDTVELWNPTTNDVNIGGWFLSDDFSTPRKYRFPGGTMIAAGGYLTVDETVLTNAATALIPFAFSSTGDEAWIFSGDATTNLTGYAYGENFGAAASGVSFGRYTNSVGKIHFVAQAANSLGAPNGAPRVGPVVISEIMYHPPDLADGSDNTTDEYIELRNISANTVLLYDTNHPADTWRLRGGAALTLPPGLSLSVGTSLLLVSFDPTDVLAISAFRLKYGISPATPIFGPYNGKLNNDLDDLKLEQPSDPDTNGVPYILIDRVEYQDTNGWPAFADGVGGSIQRMNPAAYGNDPINWAAAAPSAGGDYTGGTSAEPSPSSPPIRLALASLSATFSVTASPLPLRYQWRMDGGQPPQRDQLRAPARQLQFSQAGFYSVIVFNGAGVVISSNATLNVQIPASFLTQPQSVNMRGSSNTVDYGNTTNNATFSVLASGSGPVTYQWRFNGAPIPGAIGTTLVVTNVQLANEGVYDVLVHDDVGNIPSAGARLSVLVTPTFVLAPLAQTVPAGSQLNLSAIIRGNPPPFGYQWRSNSLIMPLVVSDSRTNYFSLRTATNASVNTYRLVVTNAASQGNGVVATFSIVTVADTDQDGLPDTVETALGLNPNDPSDGAGDLDHDGMSNRDEYIAGTDPNDANSYLRIEVNSIPGVASLKFAAVTNRTYSIQFTDQLPSAGPWSKLADFVARSTNRIETVIDPGWTTNRFYRVVLPAQ